MSNNLYVEIYIFIAAQEIMEEIFEEEGLNVNDRIMGR